MIEKIRKTEEEWKKSLTPEQFWVMRAHGMEAPFSC
jgi:peptide methionine sulfoxide reductase MsrB